MTRKLPLVLGSIAVLGLLVGSALYWQRVLEAGLPERVECASESEAWQRALAHVVDHGGSVIPVLGTGSMAPYIPAAPAGRDPMTTVVALVVTVPGSTFADIRQGQLCLYRAEWSPRFTVLHQAAQRDAGGWIMSGLANERSEPGWRVTRENFTGIAAITFVWPQPSRL